MMNKLLRFMFLIGGCVSTEVSDYYYKDAGGVCNDEKDVIRSKTECSKALSELGFEKSGSYYTYYGYPIPSGCSIRTIGFAEANKPHFLESSPGVGKGRNDLIPICKNVSKIGDSSIVPTMTKAGTTLTTITTSITPIDTINKATSITNKTSQTTATPDLTAIVTGSAVGILLFTSIILLACYYIKKNKWLTENNAEEKEVEDYDGLNYDEINDQPSGSIYGNINEAIEFETVHNPYYGGETDDDPTAIKIIQNPYYGGVI